MAIRIRLSGGRGLLAAALLALFGSGGRVVPALGAEAARGSDSLATALFPARPA